ncbi:ABC transporter permease [Streptomyces sp. NPDC057445]|uniref:ABC transporter permease n=1 Tax=Streptomyces sp. NPDC057445 TaxID=3346136 RepID=UPI0036BFA419
MNLLLPPRQHHTLLRTALVLLALGVGALVAARLAYSPRMLGCTPTPCPDDAIVLAHSSAYDWLLRILDRTSTVIMLLPLLIAAVAAGPLTARELESGTYKPAWTQSVSPARWLASKLVPAAVALTMGTLLLNAAWRWGWKSVHSSMVMQLWDNQVYAAVGITSFANGLLGLAIGVLSGLLVRRTLVAMAVSAALAGGVLAALAALRPYLWPWVSITGDDHANGPGDWWFRSGMLDASGRRLFWEDCTPGNGDTCMAGAKTFFADVHPPSDFWPIQLVETGIGLALAALATFTAFRVLRRLHA